MVADFLRGKEKTLLSDAAAFTKEGSLRRDWAEVLRRTDSPDLARLMQDLAASSDEDADASALKAARAGLVSKVVNLGGGGVLNLAGVGYEIHQGKPVAKAVVSGGLGFAAGLAASSLITGPVGLAAAGGLVAGVGASWLGDQIYDAATEKHGIVDDPGYFEREYATG